MDSYADFRESFPTVRDHILVCFKLSHLALKDTVAAVKDFVAPELLYPEESQESFTERRTREREQSKTRELIRFILREDVGTEELREEILKSDTAVRL